MLVPVALNTEGDDKLVIEWSDGQSRLYQWADLRGSCPCATCNDERARNEPAPLLPVLSQEEAKPVRPESMNPVGRNAIIQESLRLIISVNWDRRYLTMSEI